MRKKNKNQIIRFDGRNVFIEVMNTAFEIGKVQINFVEYDITLEKNSRQKQNISIYIDVEKFLLLANDILTGRMLTLARQAQDEKVKGGYKYCKEIFKDMGGVSANNLKTRGKERADGKALSRQFKITPGDKMPWILSGETGPGEENDTGLIVPKGRAEEQVRVPLSHEDMKKLALLVTSHIQGYITSLYMKEIV